MVLGEPRPQITAVAENYLQAIYKMVEREEKVTPSRLAEAMDVSLATAVGTIKRLTNYGFLQTDRNSKEVSLTSKGRVLAESVVRKHRLAERMLIDFLGLEWHKAHGEAHRLEHAISAEVEEKIALALGYPETNPYGQPIPGYSKSPRPKVPLNTVKEGEVVTIALVPESDFRLLKFFDENSLRPGQQLEVEEMTPFKGTVTVRINGDHVVMGVGVANDIMVSQ